MAPSEQPNDYGTSTGGRSGPTLLSVLRRRIWIIIAVALLTGAAAGAYAYLNRDTYESTAKLLFGQHTGPEFNAAGFSYPAPDADNLAANNIELVGSRRVAEATARELRRRGVDVSTDDVQNDVAVSGEVNSEVVQVVATDDSARGAAQLAQVYARQASRIAGADTAARARRVLNIVNKQLAALPPDQRQDHRQSARLEGSQERLEALANPQAGEPQLIQPGFAPTSESGNPVQTTILGVLFGLVLGVALALLRDQADRRLRRAEEVSDSFEAPVLTTVPRHRTLKKHARFDDLPAPVAEAFRMLQVNLRYRQEEPVRTVLVTSSRSREGKTTVSWNLASAAASSGLAVALIEADMRRPALAERYNLNPDPGLSEVLHGEVPTTAALQPVYPLPGDVSGNGNPIGGLEVMVAGRLPHDPWALTQSAAMDRMLEIVSQSHDLVVIDTPPIPHVADAISLLRRVDGVIITTLLHNTSGPDAERLRDQLSGLGAPVLGVVANGGSAVDGYSYLPGRAPVSAPTGHPDASSTIDAPPEYVPRR